MTARAKLEKNSPPPLPDPRLGQIAASDPQVSAWVNASAGSGKTTVLTARVTRLLLAGVPPQKILCLTYTRAGAAEMANRITAQFSRWTSCSEDELRRDFDRLQDAAPSPEQLKAARRLFAQLLSCPGGLRIRTIHSFCQEILSRFPIEAGLAPHFALIEPHELEVLRQEVVDDLLRAAADEPRSPLAQALDGLAQAQGEYGFDAMLRDISKERGKLEAALNNAGGLAELTARMRSFLNLQPADTAEALRDAAMRGTDDEVLENVARLWLRGGATLATAGRTLADILGRPRENRAPLFDAYRALFLTALDEPRKKFATSELTKQHPDLQATCAAEAARLLGFVERIEAAEIAELTASVLCFGSAFAETLQARKAARAALDYDDLILFTEKLLRRPGIAPWILYKLDNGIDHVLIDEAQDTSRAQWSIVEALTAEFHAGSGARSDQRRTLFVVGDEKQSIFSFQNAEPEAFLNLRDQFAHKLSDAGEKLNIVPLHISFRSAPAILHAVDRIFAAADARQGVSPDLIEHSASRRDKIGRVEVWPLLSMTADAKPESEWAVPTQFEEERDPQAELAQQIARKIKGWLTHKESLPDSARPIVPGDIMILLRRRGRFADLMVRALKSFGVPVTGVDRMHLLQQLPVMDLLAMLRFAVLPEDDLNLAALLRSPLLGYSEEQLMALAIGRTGSLWQSLRDKAAADTDFTVARDYLAQRLGEADFVTPFAFLSKLLTLPCPASTDSGRQALWARLGPEALDPIDELLNAALDFVKTRPPSLQNFLRWLTEADAEIKRELDQGDPQQEGQVRIMTVHAAKGLEAPIVFLPDTVSVPLTSDISSFQWTESGVPLFLPRQPKFGAARRLRQQARDRQLAEYRRLYYVALTRAASRLYICGWQNERRGDFAHSWYQLAAQGLQPLHQEFHRQPDDGPQPDIIYADTPLHPPPPKLALASTPPYPPLPDWARRGVDSPPQDLLLPPSAELAAAATPDSAFYRGRIIHRLLQSLPDIAEADRAPAITRFLAHPRHALSAEAQDEIASEVGKLLDDPLFADLFGPESVAEVALAGAIDGHAAFRQIDRLCLRGDEVWIVDYKTNRPPPMTAAQIPDAYRRQLREYRLLLRALYPDRHVRSFLLWTYAPRLMEISDQD